MPDPLVLPQRLDAATVTVLTAELKDAVVNGAVRLDASQVTHMGALGVQALIVAARAVTENGGVFEFTALSDKAGTHLVHMGLTPEIIAEGAL